MSLAEGPSPLALYIHWPFCESKCPYCDFNSHVREAVDQERWRQALIADLAAEARLTAGATVTSIFFGGGTPSLMPPRAVAALIDAAARHWAIAADVEITLEANPGSVEAARFEGFRAAGVNRLSLGVQALDDAALKALGRRHDMAQALAAMELARAIFPRMSFDLIYARQGQTLDAWATELRRALAFGTEHLSLYQLTIEPRTRFAELYRRGDLTLPDEDLAADMYELTGALAGRAGLAAYEISNYARPGAESLHNLAYWRYQPYVGIGPGAHGRRNATATTRHLKPEHWLDAVEHNGSGVAEERKLTPRDRAEEALLMGLRLAEGIDPQAFEAATGSPLAAIVPEERRAQAEHLGLLEPGPRLCATASGRLLLDRLVAELTT